MLALAILGIVQALFLPGLLIVRIMDLIARNRTALPDQILIATPLSILTNYYLVFFLTTTGLYIQSVMIGVIALECIAIVWLLRRDRANTPQRSHATNRFGATPRSFSKTVVGSLVLALGASLILVEYLPTMGDVFTAWDAIASWNRWAEQWAGQQLRGTLGYPQAIPVSISLVYVLAGETNLQTFAKIVTDYFPFYGFFCLWRMSVLNPTNIVAYGAASVFYSLFLLYGAPHKPHFAFSGYVDAPMAAMAAFVPYSFLLYFSRHGGIPRATAIGANVVLLILAGSSIALIKQSGLLVALIGTVLWGAVLLRDKRLPIPRLCAALGASVILATSWYVYSYFVFGDYQRAEHLISGAYSDRPREGFITLLKTLGLLPLCLALGSSLRRPALIYLFLLFVVPMFLFWAVLVSYDTRTAFVIFPWLALLAGFSIGTLFNLPIWGGLIGGLGLMLSMTEKFVVPGTVPSQWKLIGMIMIGLLLGALSILLLKHVLPRRSRSALRYVCVAIVCGGVLLLSFVFSKENLVECNKNLRIVANDKGFNRYLNDLFVHNSDALLTSEWMVAKNLPSLTGRFFANPPPMASKAWVEDASLEYYLHWSQYPGAVTLESVRDKARAARISFTEESLNPHFTLFRKIKTTAVSEGEDVAGSNSHQVTKPSTEPRKNSLLYGAITSREIGKDYGKIELQASGIMLHPGNTPTSITFRVPPELAGSTLALWMKELPPEITRTVDAGTASVAIKLGGRPYKTLPIDRATNGQIDEPLIAGEEIELTVSNVEDPFWDGLLIGVK